MKKIKLFEAFAGIGSQYKALKNIAPKMNWEIEPVGIVEWFVPAIIAYQAIHHFPQRILKESFKYNYVLSFDSKKPSNKSFFEQKTQNNQLGFWLNQSKEIANNYFDISRVEGKSIPDDIDIFTYSFPCQDISNQGKQNGFERNSQTRSGLLWEIHRILLEIKRSKNKLPKYLILENVKGIINKKNLNTFKKWLKELEKLGYESKYYLLNSINYGSCQNRERVFAISVLKKHRKRVNFKFPILNEVIINKNPIKNCLNQNIEFHQKFNNYVLKPKKLNQSNNIKKYELLNYTSFSSENFVYDINHSGPTLTASGAMSRIKLYFGKNKIREFLPIECFRYMGFEDHDFNNVQKTKLVNEAKQIYLCGNSIPVQVLEKIFESLVF